MEQVRWPLIGTLLLALVSSVPAQAQQWREVRVKDGLVLMSRKVAGERFPEFRIRATTPTSVGRLASYLMGRSIDEADPGIERTIVERSPRSATFTDLIRTPVISDRCATSRVVRKNGEHDSVELVFTSGGEWPRGKPTERCVPLRAHGSWILKPLKSATELTYTIFADPGGNLPVFLVRGMIEDDALNRVRHVLSEAAK